MANSKLHDELVNEVEPQEDVDASIAALADALANRLEAAGGDPVKLTDLKTILRENPGKVANAVLANTPAARVKQRSTSGFEAPTGAFDRPREGVRTMTGSPNDHRDQVFPENSNTEAERQRIKQENRVRDRGAVMAVNVDLPEPTEAEAKADEKAKADTKAIQQGKKPSDR